MCKKPLTFQGLPLCVEVRSVRSIVIKKKHDFRGLIPNDEAAAMRGLCCICPKSRGILNGISLSRRPYPSRRNCIHPENHLPSSMKLSGIRGRTCWNFLGQRRRHFCLQYSSLPRPSRSDGQRKCFMDIDPFLGYRCYLVAGSISPHAQLDRNHAHSPDLPR